MATNPVIYAAYLGGQAEGQEAANRAGLQMAMAMGRNGSTTIPADVASPLAPPPGLSTVRPAQPVAAPAPTAPAAVPVGLSPSQRAAGTQTVTPDEATLANGLLKKSGQLYLAGDVDAAAKTFLEANKLSDESYKSDVAIAAQHLAATNNQDLTGYVRLINNHKDRFGFEAVAAGVDPATGKLWMDVRKPGAAYSDADTKVTAGDDGEGGLKISNAAASKDPAAAPTQRVTFTPDEINQRMFQMADPAKAFEHFVANIEKEKDRKQADRHHNEQLQLDREKFEYEKNPTGLGNAAKVRAARDSLKQEVRARLGIGTTQFDKLDDAEKQRQIKVYDSAAKAIDDDANLPDVLVGRTDKFVQPAEDGVKRETVLKSVAAAAGAGYTGPTPWKK